MYGSPFSLYFTLFPSLSACSNGLHTLSSLFIHPNIPPIVCSMHPVSDSSPSPCDQMCDILLLFIPHPLDDQGPFLSHGHLPSSLTYPQARPLSLVVQGSAWGEGFLPSTTQQAMHHIMVTVTNASFAYQDFTNLSKRSRHKGEEEATSIPQD